MKLLEKAALVCAATLLPVAAQATTVVSSTTYGLNTPPAGAGAYVTFDGAGGGLAGFTLSGSGYVVQTGNNGNGAAPADGPTNASDDATNYLSTFGGTASLLGGTAYRSVSLYWGSIDQYNWLDLLDAAGNTIGTVTYADIGAGANGDQLSGNTNRRVSIGTDFDFYGVGVRSTSAAFEVDNIKFLSSVPEPTTWAMMIGGFGFVGGAMRRRTARSLAAA